MNKKSSKKQVLSVNKSKKTNIQPKIAIASDHAGFELKEFLIGEFAKSDIKLQDLGCQSAKISVDYPDFAKKLAKKIIEKKADFGILICGSGIGISIAANRFKEVRAALCLDSEMAKLARNHNSANVICLGARLTNPKKALACVKTFLQSEFENGRHEKRVAKLSK